MDKEMKQKKLDAMEKQVKTYNDYMGCLFEHRAEIEEAALEKNYCAVQKTFVKCHVPKSQWKKGMNEIMDCPDMQPWA